MSEWIEHRGYDLPVPLGTSVVVMSLDGTICGPLPAGISRGASVLDYPWRSLWHWACCGYIYSVCDPKNVIAYRIVDAGAEAETKRRTARMDTFRKMADAVSPIAPDPKLPAPKKRERV